ncbi:MAG TPA: hypothetical protein VK983_03765 [Candidatus Limnocylindrales bacterium]|nr:hypothetical protein [Candidatus Limnocylindrales bacterium]
MDKSIESFLQGQGPLREQLTEVQDYQLPVLLPEELTEAQRGHLTEYYDRQNATPQDVIYDFSAYGSAHVRYQLGQMPGSVSQAPGTEYSTEGPWDAYQMPGSGL